MPQPRLYADYTTLDLGGLPPPTASALFNACHHLAAAG